MLRVAIIGFGFIGKRYAAMIEKNAYTQLTAIVDSHPDTLEDLLPGNTEVFSDLNSLLSSGCQIDLAIIATPNGLHAEQAITLLESNCDVIIEKPIALSDQDTNKIIEKAGQTGRKAFPVNPSRYSPISTWLADVTRSGIMGKTFMVQINCYWNRDSRYYNNTWRGLAALDGGPLFTQFYHFLDLLLWLYHDITNLECHFADFNHQQMTEFEDSGIITFSLPGGGLGSFNYSTAVWNSNLESSITIISENGSVKVGGQYMQEVQVCNIKGYNFDKEKVPSNISAVENHQNFFDDVVDSILNNKTNGAEELLESKKVIELINRIYSKQDIHKVR